MITIPSWILHAENCCKIITFHMLSQASLTGESLYMHKRLLELQSSSPSIEGSYYFEYLNLSVYVSQIIYTRPSLYLMFC